jgi:predicted RNA-binding protein with PUA-like domain
MRYWQIKSEPDVFSIDDLAKEKKGTTCWDGVRNYQARNFLRDDFKKGDKVIFYHSNAEPPSAAGLCEVVREGYPDHTAFDPASAHYDPKSRKDSPAWITVDIKFIKKFPRSVSINEIRQNKKLQEMLLIQRGNRLSVMPLTKEEFEEIVRMGG